MKYLKITLRKNVGSSRLIYPENYQSEIGDFNFQHKGHLYYDDDKGEPRLLLSIADNDFKSSMVRDYVEEITEEEAKAISEANETRTEQIVDEGKLRRIELKVALKQSLTQGELDAINPEKSNSVFKPGKILADKIEDFKTIETKLEV